MLKADKKKILVLGGTGAMGAYLVPELLRLDFEVFVTSRSERQSNDKLLHYILGDAKDKIFIEELLKQNNFDSIVDFMLYGTEEFKNRYKLLLSKTKHYIYVSSFRVYGKSSAKPLDESYPRLLDTLKDSIYLKTDEYALAKARQEDLLTKSKKKNWTIIRPAITYSKDRFFLGGTGTDGFLYRALQNKPLIFPKEILKKNTTMTWAADAAKMISLLVLNKKAQSEIVNVSTSESNTWEEVLSRYKEFLGVDVKLVSKEEYLNVYGLKYMFKYNRMYDRVIDNSKVLSLTGLKQEELMPLNFGLRMELSAFSQSPKFGKIDKKREKKIDALTRSRSVKIKKKIAPRTRLRQVKAIVKGRIKFDGAIVTLTVYNNYGNIIQRYALQKFLSKNNLQFIMLELHQGKINKNHRQLKKFVDRYLVEEPFSPRISKFYKRYVVGSDQVWRHFSVNKGWKNFGIQFLSFVKSRKAIRVAYAASFGVDSLESAGIVDKRREKVERLIKKFDSVSVREESGVALAKDLGANKVDQTLDPTLLLPASDYTSIINESKVRNKIVSPIFYYLIDPTPLIQDTIEQFEESTGKKAEGILPYLGPFRGVPLAPMEEWLKRIRDAEVVIADSYHAVVFSIIFHTPFIVFNKKGGGIARIEDLLKPLGLEDRIIIQEDIGDSVDIGSYKKIDWKKVDKLLGEKRRYSKSWLLNALK